MQLNSLVGIVSCEKKARYKTYTNEIKIKINNNKHKCIFHLQQFYKSADSSYSSKLKKDSVPISRRLRLSFKLKCYLEMLVWELHKFSELWRDDLYIRYAAMHIVKLPITVSAAWSATNTYNSWKNSWFISSVKHLYRNFTAQTYFLNHILCYSHNFKVDYEVKCGLECLQRMMRDVEKINKTDGQLEDLKNRSKFIDNVQNANSTLWLKQNSSTVVGILW